jgi:putative phosphoribosyl transferase
MVFENRQQAGKKLGEKLAAMQSVGTLDPGNAVVIALPRGGVPPGFEIARILRLPLDVCVVRKVGAPMQPELALAAVSEGGEIVVNDSIRKALGLSADDVEALAAPKRAEVQERVRKFRGGRGNIPVRGKTVILVDDGLATGATAMVAIHVLRKLQAKRIVFALPVCPAGAVPRFRAEVDELLVLQAPAVFNAVGQWYADFNQVSDDEVRDLLRKAAELQSREEKQ